MLGRGAGGSFARPAEGKAAAVEENKKCRLFKIRESTFLEYVGEAALQMPEKQAAEEEDCYSVGRQY